MAFPFLLLATQAAGIGIDLIKNSISNRAENQAYDSKSRFLSYGASLEQKEIDIRMQQEELSASEESLMSLKRLREVMSTQAVIFGARGQKTGTGSALSASQGSINEFNADERARNLSKSFRKLQLENQKSISKLNHLAGESSIQSAKSRRTLKQTMGLVNKGLNMFTQSFGLNDIK